MHPQERFQVLYRARFSADYWICCPRFLHITVGVPTTDIPYGPKETKVLLGVCIVKVNFINTMLRNNTLAIKHLNVDAINIPTNSYILYIN